jgi:uncharacterized membrane protein
MRALELGDRLLRRVRGDDIASQTAALVSTAAIGASFEPGLLPRRGLDQAVATGIVGATQYGLVVTTQSIGAAAARAIARRNASPWSGFVAQAGVMAAVVAAGTVVQRRLHPYPGEPVSRAFLRTAGLRGQRVGAASLFVTAIQAMDEGAARSGRRPLRPLATGSGLLAGTALAAWRIGASRREASDPNALPPAVDPLSPAATWVGEAEQAAADQTAAAAEAMPMSATVRSLAIGTLVSAGLQGLAYAESLAARSIARGILRVAPGAGALAPAVGHAVALGAYGAGVVAGIEYIDRKAEFGGAAVDAAYTAPPDVDTVSGGPASSVEWKTLSREGVRFVNMALTPQEISEVTGVPVDQVRAPVRAFAGLASAPTVDARVDLVMRDLEQLGAFERSVICIASPTGSGYVNYVAVEAMEYLTRGDCATVALQYSLRPSFLSLDRVAMGREQNRALLHALSWRIRAIPEENRPRLVAFGESLGAHTMQDAFLYEGTAGFHRVGLDRALFLGTPAGSKWAKQWRVDPDRTDIEHQVVEVSSYDEWLEYDAKERGEHRYVLLSHHEDPITKFEPALAVQQPAWLGDPDARPRGIPRSTVWRPLITFVHTMVDTKNAMDVVPGTFVARGHDYRADLARMVSVAYALAVDDDELLRVEHALRSRELAWAERRLVAEQLLRAKEAVGRQLGSWGVTGDVPMPA